MSIILRFSFILFNFVLLTHVSCIFLLLMVLETAFLAQIKVFDTGNVHRRLRLMSKVIRNARQDLHWHLKVARNARQSLV